MKVFLIVSLVGFVVWSFRTIAICRDVAGEKADRVMTFHERYSKYAPPWWKRITRIIIVLWVIAFVCVGVFLGWEA